MRLVLRMPAGNLAGVLRKAEQLGFVFGPRKEVQEPGKHGGRYYRTETGKVKYGEKPQPKVPAAPVAKPAVRHLTEKEHEDRYEDALEHPVPKEWGHLAEEQEDKDLESGPVSPPKPAAEPATPPASLIPKDEDYAYKDIGYVAGSRKELAQQAIKLAAKAGRQVNWHDVDWQALEENTRAAEALITKGNVFGDVDWKAFEAVGMDPGAGYLIRAIYASVATEPDASDLLRRQASGGTDEGGIYSMKRAQDPMEAIAARLRSAVTIEEKQALFRDLGGEALLPKLSAAQTTAEREAVLKELGALAMPQQAEITAQARQDYVRGINTLRQRMEACKSPGDVLKALEEIGAERGGTMLSAGESDHYTRISARRQELFQQGREYQQAMDVLSKPAHFAASEHSSAKYEQARRANRGWKPDPTLDAHVANLEAVKNAAWEKFIAAKRGEEEKARDAEIRNLGGMMRSIETAARKRNLTENPITRAWHALGERFANVLAYRSDKGSGAFAKNVAMVRAGKVKDWSWAETEPKAKGGATQESVRFQLLVADSFDRVGGRPAPIESSSDLQKKFNLRAVQSGNWVLRDVNSGKFHMEQCAAAFSDLADILKIDEHLVSMNGRLAMAFGARGKGGAKAHYEPIERVINITKMEGAGSLAHEWFHALDNLMLAAYGVDGAELFGTDLPAQNTALPPAVREAFENLNRAMTTGTVRQQIEMHLTAGDDGLVRQNMQPERMGSGFRHAISTAPSLEAALDQLGEMHEAERFGRGRRGAVQFDIVRRIAAGWWTRDQADTDRKVTVPRGKGTSQYLADARSLNKTNPLMFGPETYWAQRHELAARAFAAYASDRLEAGGRRNEYLTFKADNKFYRFSGARPYPEGGERIRINAAFDRLFEALRGEESFRKALAVGGRGRPWRLLTKARDAVRLILIKGRRVVDPRQLSLFGDRSIKENPENYLGVDRIGRLHWRTPGELPKLQPVPKAEPAPVSPTKPPVEEDGPNPQRAEKLRKLADAMRGAIDDRVNPAIGKMNVTARRDRIAGNMRQEGERLEGVQKVLYRLAEMAEQGTMPAGLERISNRKDVERFTLHGYQPCAIDRRSAQRLLEAARADDNAVVQHVLARTIVSNPEDEMGKPYILPLDQTYAATLEGWAKGHLGGGDKWDVRNAAERFLEDLRDHRAYVRLGIYSQDQYDQARAEIQKLKPERSESPREQQIREAERKLIGTKIPGYFPTPKSAVDQLLDLAEIHPGLSVLEPSAGKGNIADVIREKHPDAQLECLEINQTLSDILLLKQHKLLAVAFGDFLQLAKQYDRIVMNPPFEQGQDIDHVRHAYKLLVPGGKLVSVMSEGPFFRGDHKSEEFRDWLAYEVYGTSQQMEEGAFKSSERPTGVRTRIVVIEKPFAQFQHVKAADGTFAEEGEISQIRHEAGTGCWMMKVRGGSWRRMSEFVPSDGDARDVAA